MAVLILHFTWFIELVFFCPSGFQIRKTIRKPFTGDLNVILQVGSRGADPNLVFYFGGGVLGARKEHNCISVNAGIEPRRTHFWLIFEEGQCGMLRRDLVLSLPRPRQWEDILPPWQKTKKKEMNRGPQHSSPNQVRKPAAATGALNLVQSELSVYQRGGAVPTLRQWLKPNVVTDG